MSLTIDQIRAEAMALTPTDRETQAEELLRSLSEAEQEQLDAEWLSEIRRRDALFKAGQMSSAPVDEVIARIMAKKRL